MHGPVATSPLSSFTGHGPLYAADLSLWPLSGRNEGLSGRVMETGTARLTQTPVVFLHGLVGLNDHWESVVSKVRDQLRCILFELPLLQLRGDDCCIEGVTRLTEQFLAERIGRPSIIVGNSFGGHVSLRVALNRPELVGALVLAGSSGILEKTLVSDLQIRPTKTWLKRKIGELFYDQANMSEADVDRAFAELSERGGARAMVRLSRSARRDEMRDRIGRISAPTLIIWGKQDVVTPPVAAEGFAKLIHGSRLEWLDQCGHAPMIEKPDEFARLLLQFTATVP